MSDGASVSISVAEVVQQVRDIVKDVIVAMDKDYKG